MGRLEAIKARGISSNPVLAGKQRRLLERLAAQAEAPATPDDEMVVATPELQEASRMFAVVMARRLAAHPPEPAPTDQNEPETEQDGVKAEAVRRARVRKLTKPATPADPDQSFLDSNLRLFGGGKDSGRS